MPEPIRDHRGLVPNFVLNETETVLLHQPTGLKVPVRGKGNAFLRRAMFNLKLKIQEKEKKHGTQQS